MSQELVFVPRDERFAALMGYRVWLFSRAAQQALDALMPAMLRFGEAVRQASAMIARLVPPIREHRTARLSRMRAQYRRKQRGRR